MTNFKRRKPKKNSKLYRNGIDGIGCPYCGSNWLYKKFKNKMMFKWEKENEKI